MSAVLSVLDNADRQAAQLRPDHPTSIDSKPWLRFGETHPDNLDGENAAYGAEFSKIGIEAVDGNSLINAVMRAATGEFTQRQKYARHEQALAAVNQSTRGDFQKVRTSIDAWLVQAAPQVRAMLLASGALGDAKVLHELYKAYQSARGRGKAK